MFTLKSFSGHSVICFVCSEFMFWLLILLVSTSCSVILQGREFSFSCLSLSDFPCWSGSFALVSAWL